MTDSSSKTVFKIFASFGPAGSIVTMAEKICRRVFSEAYDLGETTFTRWEDSEIKKLRQDFVNELFGLRGPFETKSQSLNPVVQFKAHAELWKLIERFKRKITHLEKQKLHKEMTFFLREENSAKYQQAKSKIETIEEDVDDNLKKMAFHIMHPDPEKYIEDARTSTYDEESDIEERVTILRAEEILEFYKREIIRAEMEYANDEFGKQEYIELIKERIYVDFGEDVQDAFLAISHYGLSTVITEDDRIKYKTIIEQTPNLNDSFSNIKPSGHRRSTKKSLLSPK